MSIREGLIYSDLLEQSEVDELPDGQRIVVTWSSGNGPHEYALRVKDGRPCAVLLPDGGYIDQEVVVGQLDFVGKMRYHTHVLIVLE